MNEERHYYAQIIPWAIVGLLFLATALSFLDRQVLSFAIIRIKEDIHISDMDYSRINAAFIIGYAIMFTLSGIIIDRYGTRIGLGFSVLLWSIASAFHAMASNAMQFGLFRFVLGVGEGGAFPGAIKSVIEWIPLKKRALANGIAIGGAAIGAVVAPLLCLWLLDVTGWRAIFLITGAIGLVWTAAWFVLTSGKNAAYRVGQVDVNTVSNIQSPGKQNYSLLNILKNRTVWIFILMRVLFDPILYFLMFWTPKFLNEYREMSLDNIVTYLWIPYLVLGISNIAGGSLSDRIMNKTNSLNLSRKIPMGMAALITLTVVSIPFIDSPAMVIGIISLFFLAHGFWITGYVTTIGDIFGNVSTSTIVGLSGTAGAISGTISSIVIGWIVTGWSYDPLWVWAGLMYPVAFLLFLVFVPFIKRSDR